MASAEVERIRFGPNAQPSDISSYSLQILTSLLDVAGLPGCLVTSTARRPGSQARVMYDNCESTGVLKQLAIYREPGQDVIKVYSTMKQAARFTRDEIIVAMARKIVELGPENVSHHCADARKKNVFDIGAHSVAAKNISFEHALGAEPRVSKWMHENQCYHVEIDQPQPAENAERTTA